MSTTTVTKATERAAALRKQLTVLGSQKQATESKLAEEHAAIRRAATKRAELVDSLIGVSEAVGRSAHREIDQLDGVIRVSERMAESLQRALAKAVQEIEALHAEVLEVERVIRAEERERALEAFRINLQQAARRASESLDNARADLAAFVILETEAVVNGDDAHVRNIQRICEPIFEEFKRQQANLDSRGFKLFVGTRGLQFQIRPMSRG